MKATDISGQAPGGKRTQLAEVLPLDTPYVVQIFPIYACVFQCQYCIFSVPLKQRGFISDTAVMDLTLYKKCIDDLARFPRPIKVLRFVGIGEPLLHPDIAAMIRYAVKKKVAHTVELLTNGSLLTPEMSDALIAAGLSRLVVSLQGTTKEKYWEVSRANINFEQFVENLRYFFTHKGHARMYLKIVDCALEDKADEKRFYKIFGDLCDTIAIERAVPIHAGVNFEKILKDRDSAVTQFGLPVAEVRICPQPFFHMQINPDGKVVPCYSFEYPQIVGDCNQQSLNEIWKGKTFQQFRRAMLDGIKIASPTCARCTMYKYRQFPEDELSSAAERLKKIYA